MVPLTHPVRLLSVLLVTGSKPKYPTVTNIIYKDNKVSGINKYGVVIEQDYEVRNVHRRATIGIPNHLSA